MGSRQEISQYFKANNKNWFGNANPFDCTIYSSLNDARRSLLRSNFNIPLDEEILFSRDTSFFDDGNQGTVITDRGIYVIPDNDSPEDGFIIEWNEFDNVEYKELTFYFYSNGNICASLYYEYLFKCQASDLEFWRVSGICNFFKAIASLAPADLDPLDFANEGNYEKAIELADLFIEEHPDWGYGYLAKGRTIYMEQCNAEKPDPQRVLEAIEIIRKGNEYTEVGSESESIYYNNIGYCYELIGQNYNARNCYVWGMDGAEDKKEALEKIDQAESELAEIWDKYTDIYDYPDRKFCMIVRDYDLGGCCSSAINVFRQSNVPSALKFPMGHPYPNQIYIGHPFNKSLYVPYEDSEDIFFMDKVQELCYLLECLGAEQIQITSVKGKEVSEMSNFANGVSGSADVKLFSGEGEINKSGSFQRDSSDRTARAFVIRLDPMNKPYLPENLIWYNEQPDWQRLVERRLKNNILDYSESVKSSQTRFTSSAEVSDIKAAAEYLWMKANANVKQNTDAQFKTHSETEWNISVKFRSLKDFDNPQNASSAEKSLSKAEQEYLEEVKFCLEEDGIITPKEEKMLGRLRDRLGISQSRAEELTQMLLPSLSSDEQEYADEIKACLEDGEISEREMRMLDRYRVRLGISESRAAEIMKSIIK